MPTCFVIQPFDKGKYDKRFEDVFRPAIEAAGLDAYRVDRDHSVEVPIDAIEAGIRRAAACLADITDDNPNVWYELGYASASTRPVVMVCSAERTRFPFDIQHRSIITYTSESPRDFDKLRASITDRLKALLDKSETLRQLTETEQVAPVAGLSQPELFVLATLAGTTLPTGDTASLAYLRNQVERTGLTAVGFSLGVHRLRTKGLIEIHQMTDHDGDAYDAASLSDQGWAWMDRNEDKFLIRREKAKSSPKAKGNEGEFDDDIPF